MSQDMKHSAGKVYDNVTLKLEAWRKALDFVFLVLQTEIITGIDPKQVEGQSNVMALWWFLIEHSFVYYNFWNIENSVM